MTGDLGSTDLGGQWSQNRLSKREKPQSLLLSPAWEAEGVQVSEWHWVQNRIHPSVTFYLQLPTGVTQVLGLSML